jgi:hypothetical protein
MSEKFDEFDYVEIIEVPEKHKGIIDIGDIGVLLDKYDDENFEVECVQEDGSYKWLEPLNIRYFKLVGKDPLNINKKKTRDK